LLVKKESVSSQTFETQINLSSYIVGIYYIEFIPENNKDKMIYTTKLELIK